jgi:hypothetical protein
MEFISLILRELWALGVAIHRKQFTAREGFHTYAGKRYSLSVLTVSMEKSHSWKADSRSASQ